DFWGGSRGALLRRMAEGGRSHMSTHTVSIGSRGRASRTHTLLVCRREFQGSGEMRADAGGLFGRRNDPLSQRGAGVAALDLVLDLDVADEVASGFEARVHGMRARKHAVEDESHVVGFEELSDGQHATGFLRLPSVASLRG